jgi:hypothetical protein
MAMNKHVNSSLRRPARWALLPALAVVGTLLGLTNAFAFDRQATDDALDNAINYQAARGAGYTGSYAQAPDAGPVYAPRHHRHR